MKYFVNAVVKNIQGVDFKDRDESNKEVPLTLGLAALNALLGKMPQDQGLPGNIKMLHWELAKKMKKAMASKADFVEISTEHLGLLKTRILQVYDTHVAGPICDLIEGGEDQAGSVVPMVPGQ